MSVLLGGRARIRDLYRHEKRFRLRQLLLPTEQNARRYPIAPRYLRQAGARPHRFFDDPAFVLLGELPPMRPEQSSNPWSWQAGRQISKAP
jgi:hypothetical protein